MQHHFGNPAGHEHLRGWVSVRPVRQRVDQAGGRAIDANPVVDSRRPQPCRRGNRRNVQQQIGGSAERGVHHHRVFNSGAGEDAIDRDPARVQAPQRRGGAAGEFQPDGFTRRRERGVRERKTQGLGHHLRCRRRS